MSRKSTFGLLGVPWDFTASLGWPGSRYAPAAIREAFKWIAMRYSEDGFYWIDEQQGIAVDNATFLVDRGDVEVLASDLSESFRRIAIAAGTCWIDGQTLIALGGDDGITYPIVKGLHDASDGTWGVIHLDAHMDLLDRSPFQGAYSHSSHLRRITELSRVDSASIVQIGGRNFNFLESREYALSRGITQITAAQYWDCGTQAIVSKTVEAVHSEHTHLAIDVDVLDPAFAPGVGAFEPGGLTSRQLLDFIAGIAQHVDSLSIAEVNPLVDFRSLTSSVAANIVGHFIASRLGAL